MVYSAFFICLILIFPLVFTVYLYYDNANKKLYIALYLFKFFKMLSGYIVKRQKGGFYFHITNDKVIILNKDIIYKFKGGPEFLPIPVIFNSYSIIDSGIKSDDWLSFLFAFYTVLRNFNCVMTNEIKFLTLKTDLNVLNDDVNLINVKLRLIFSFNLLGILYKFFDSLLLRGINYVKKQRAQAK